MSEDRNLIEVSNFPEEWEEFNRGDEKAEWAKDDSGAIVQKNVVGSRKQASGTLLVHKALQLNNGSIITLQIEPGATNQTGLVFDYTNDKNFSLFFLDRKSETYTGHQLTVATVTEGKYRRLGSETYTGLPGDVCTFGIQSTDDGLSLQFNGQEVFNFTDDDLGKNGRIGLYSQKNDTARFLSLQVENGEISIPICPDYDAPENGVIPEQPEQPVQTPATPELPIDGENHNLGDETTGEIPSKAPIKEIGREIVKFLSLQEPAAKTTIEFKEVFTIPLDEYYQSILNTHDLTSDNGSSTTNGNSLVEYLDVRTKRWYRLYHDYSNKIKYAKIDYNFAKKRLEISEENIDNFLNTPKSEASEGPTFSELERDLEDRRATLIHRRNLIYKYRDKISVLLREIRTNGYNVKDNTEVEKIKEAGYDFQIDKSVNESRYKPVQLDPQMWLGEDNRGNENWQETLNKMSQLLLEGDLLSEANRTKYLEQARQLEKLEYNDLLNEKIEKIEIQISNHNKEILCSEALLEAKTAQSQLWHQDFEDLRKVKRYLEDTYFGSDRKIENMTSEDCYNYAIDLGKWSKGELGDNFYKPINLTESPEDPGANYYNLYTDYPYKFRTYGVNNINSSTRLYELISFQRDGKDGFDFYGLRVFSYLLTNIIKIHTLNNNTLIEFILCVSGEASNSSDLYTSHKVRVGKKDINNVNNHSCIRRLHAFFDGATETGKYSLGHIEHLIERANKNILNSHNLISEHNREITAIKEYGLHKQRWDFINKWNDPEKNETGSIKRKPVLPASDPLAEFLIETSGNRDDINSEVVFFQPSASGFYNQYGQSLENFMEGNDNSESVIVLPYFDSQGGISNEVIQVVKNPVASKKSPGFPIIKLVENYTVEVGWQGYGLGELSHSFNLFPGETKEMVVEKSTKRTTKISEKVGREEARKQSQTSSFEDNLKNELTSGQKASQSSEDKDKVSATDKSLDKSSDGGESSASQEDSYSETRNWEVAAKAEADWGWGNLEVSGSAGGKTDSKKNRQSSSKSTWNRSNEDAYEISKATEGERKNNQSTEVMQKNLSNSIKKVASETSQNNKLEFSSTSSEEYQEESTNKEVIKLENPNIGKTVNYNFFQVQNIYGTSVRLTDVKIVIDTGKELIDKTGINDVKVYELEEFGKIYCNSDGSERSAILSAIIAKKVLNHYAKIGPYFMEGNGALQVREGFEIDNGQLKIIEFLGGAACKAGCEDEIEETNETQLDLIRGALHYLKKVPFEFKDSVLSVMKEEPRICVNAAAYHVEAQVGLMPATEQYLEDRRDIETDRQRALTEELRARTKAGVFHPELPQSITSLSLDGDSFNGDLGNPSGDNGSGKASNTQVK